MKEETIRLGIIDYSPFHGLVGNCQERKMYTMCRSSVLDKSTCLLFDVYFRLYDDFSELSHRIVFTILLPETNTGEVMI